MLRNVLHKRYNEKNVEADGNIKIKLPSAQTNIIEKAYEFASPKNNAITETFLSE